MNSSSASFRFLNQMCVIFLVNAPMQPVQSTYTIWSNYLLHIAGDSSMLVWSIWEDHGVACLNNSCWYWVILLWLLYPISFFNMHTPKLQMSMSGGNCLSVKSVGAAWVNPSVALRKCRYVYRLPLKKMMMTCINVTVQPGSLCVRCNVNTQEETIPALKA